MANADKLALGLDDIIRLDRPTNRRGGGGNRGFRARAGRGGGSGFRTRGGGGIPRGPNPSATGRSSPPAVTPHYGSTSPGASKESETDRPTRCATGVSFIRTIPGILNIAIIVALVCVIICAGVASGLNCKMADNSNLPTHAKVSAYNTRNAVLAFAIIGLILILVDTILQMTSLINRLPAIFDIIFIITMLVLAGIFFILGCCAAAWEQKMNDTVKKTGKYVHPGAAGAASFFLFVTMLAVIADFLIRLLRPASRNVT